MGSLDDWLGLTPVSRRDNPATSYEAETGINSSGSRTTHLRAVLRIVEDMPGLTTGEIGESSGLGQMETRKRLSDLKNTGQVRQGYARIWPQSGRRQSTWWPSKGPVQGELL